jgi:ubiquitin carboxyl-terminal hydrolase 5/13
LNEKRFYFENDYSLYIYPMEMELQLNDKSSDTQIDEQVRKSMASIINAESITYKEELAAQAAAWDGEQRFPSKHSFDLQQLPEPTPVSPMPSSWKCEMCDIRNNLWLNLTDGKILCGRRQMDGSGGNNHAIEHYKKTKYPLSVKLGTITSKSADVFSYDEDDMVEDVNLAAHLQHFGINMANMEKTEKTMAELEIDLNQKVSEWDRIQESASKLVSVYGPGYTGMRNLGNSCYMNSVMQVLFTVPDFADKYYKRHDEYARSAPLDPANDLSFQMAKLGYGLLSGRYSIDPATQANQLAARGILPPPKGIRPLSFKQLIGKGHAEFSTKRQQDAHEFLMHLLAALERAQRNDKISNTMMPSDAFKFEFEERLECEQSRRVRYTRRTDYCLSVPVAKHAVLNKEKLCDYEKRKAEMAAQGLKPDAGDLVRPEIRLVDCIAQFAQTECIDDFYSSATKKRGRALKRTRLCNFPDYLFVQVRKFEFAADWSPIKIDVALQVPDVLNMSDYRCSGGAQEDEVLLNDDGDDGDEQGQTKQEEAFAINEQLINQLMDMGFSLDASKRAVYNTREENNAEAATNWAITHMEDVDFNKPFEMPSLSSKKKPRTSKSSESGGEQPNKKAAHYDEAAIESIKSWGFNRQQAIRALEATDNNLERAADWIFSHADEIANLCDEPQQTTTMATATATTSASNTHDTAAASSSSRQENRNACRDGNGQYNLVAFISHMGTNANVGHYVCHILKENKWVIYNDENVAFSENPPKELAYLYVYKRADAK